MSASRRCVVSGHCTPTQPSRQTTLQLWLLKLSWAAGAPPCRQPQQQRPPAGCSMMWCTALQQDFATRENACSRCGWPCPRRRHVSCSRGLCRGCRAHDGCAFMAPPSHRTCMLHASHIVGSSPGSNMTEPSRFSCCALGVMQSSPHRKGMRRQHQQLKPMHTVAACKCAVSSHACVQQSCSCHLRVPSRYDQQWQP